MRKRQRRRGSGAQPSKINLSNLFIILLGLALILIYKATMGDQTLGFLDTLAGDPNQELPKESVLNRMEMGLREEKSADAALKERNLAPPEGR